MRRLFLLMVILFLCVPYPVWADETTRRTPTFSECQTLASAKTSAQEKAALTQLFKKQNFYCSMVTPSFVVQPLFNQGQMRAQLRLTISPSNHYRIDGKTLLAALIPDHKNIPMPQMMMLVVQIVGVLGDLLNANVDPMSATHVSRKVGTLAGIMGVNAREAIKQLEILRINAKLNEDHIAPSFWLTKFASLDPPQPNTEPHYAMQNPAWMQKAGGIVQHFMGMVQGMGE